VARELCCRPVDKLKIGHPVCDSEVAITRHRQRGTPFHGRDCHFKEPNEVERAERHQETDSARINAAVEAAEKGITTVATRQLDPTEMPSECSATRDRTILAVRDERHNIIKRANAGKETERWIVENWLREATDARILHEFTADLKKLSTRDLVDSVRI
jgi:hypothetical protein